MPRLSITQIKSLTVEELIAKGLRPSVAAWIRQHRFGLEHGVTFSTKTGKLTGTAADERMVTP